MRIPRLAQLVPREDIARGYEVGKGRYLIVEDNEFEVTQIESTLLYCCKENINAPRRPIIGAYLAVDGQSKWSTRVRRSRKLCEMQQHLNA